jgi:protease II
MTGSEARRDPKYTLGSYPNIRRDESLVENLHGTPVKDPYRWLEDPHTDEAKVSAILNQLAVSHMEHILKDFALIGICNSLK